MANRTLRSRTVELKEDGVEFSAGESDGDRPSEQSEVLGSVDERLEGLETITRQVPESETLNTEVTETGLGQSDFVEVMEGSPSEISIANPNDLRNLFDSLLSAVKDQMQALQNNVLESKCKPSKAR